MLIYRHKITGHYLRLIRERASGLNTYLEVTENNEPILEKRCWSLRNKMPQERLIRGFDNLEFINNVLF